jgi:D-alanine transaminase
MTLAYLNGEYLPLEECKVSVLDRGFLFGDAIYELIPVYNKKPFRIQAHLARLYSSIAKVNLNNPFDEQGWLNIINTLIDKSGLQNLYIYLQVTRGVAPRDHAFPATATPTVFAMIGNWPKLDPKVYSHGISAVTVPDIRWNRCDIKVTSLLANVLMRQHAVQHNAVEAIFIRDGVVLEGAATNIFVVMGNKVLTAPKDNLILPGITRDVVVELAHENNIELLETPATEAQLSAASEVWMTSSTKECLPITSVNEQAVGDGVPGKLWQQVYDLFQTHKQSFYS